MVVARVVAFVAGGGIVLSVLLSAIRTVVVPRGEPVLLTRGVFGTMRVLFDLRVGRAKSYRARDRAMASYAPVSLVVLPGTWVAFTIAGFTGVFWGLGVDPLRAAFELSGSSMLTLGIEHPPDLATSIAAFTEATLGLGMVGLLISYLPSIYAAFQRRELRVAQLVTRAGEPPSAVELILRHQRLLRLDALDDLWEPWEEWFADVEETHTSQPSLVFFRSISDERSWITAAGVLLDTAAFRASTLALPRNPRAELCLRAGYLSLRRIAGYFAIALPEVPRRGDPISIDREEFNGAYETLAAEGVPLKPDRELAWQDFAGWRINYDAALVGLAGVAMAPYAPWSSDRSIRPVAGRASRWRARPRR